MKKVMVIICIVLLIIATGCSAGDGSTRKTDSLDEITIYDGIRDNNNAAGYLEYLKTNKGIKLNSIPRDRKISIRDIDGLLKIYSDIYKLAFNERHEYFLPLNDILAGNNTVMDIPEGIMNAVTDEDGRIWALLLSHRFNTKSRVYNEKMMEQLGADIPRTIGEFKDLLILAKESIGTDIIRVSEDTCSEMFFDVFAFFKCGMINSMYTVSWDEERQLFMDHASTNEMLQSLKFIKELDEAELITTGMGKGNLIASAFNNDNVFTIAMSNNSGLDNIYSSNGFDGSKFTLEIGFENSFLYVVPFGTSDADRKVNDFINAFFEDEEMNKAGYWGIDGKNYTYISPEFISINDPKTIYMPWISDCWLTNFYIPLRSGEKQEDYEYWMENNWVKIQRDYYDGVYRVLPIDKSISDEDRGLHATDIHIHNAFSITLFKFIKEDMSVDAFFEEYEKEMKKLGIEEYLDGLNSLE